MPAPWLKEVREPGRLHDPDERNVEHPTGNWNRRIRPGNDRDGVKPLENGNFVVDTLDHFCISKGGRELFAAIHLGDKFDFLLRQAGFHTRQGKAVLLDHGLEIAAVGDEMDVEGLARCGWRSMALAISTMRLVSARLNAQGAKRIAFFGIILLPDLDSKQLTYRTHLCLGNRCFREDDR
jgi:hypothetical protein